MKVAALRAAGVVPKPIVDTLMRLIRRTRWLITLRGICATVAAAVGALLLVMAVDASVTLYSLSTRWVLSASAYAITVGAALWFLVRPLAHSFTLSGIARTIETRHPELQERISSAVELLTTDDAPELRGSEQLIGALVEQATDNVRGIQPRREVSLAAAKPFLVVAAAVMAILAGLFALWPDTTAFLLARASAPFLNRPNLLGRDLTVEPGDVVLAEGQRLEVQVAVPRRSVRRAHLLVVGADGTETSQRMALLNPGADDRRFALTTAPATQDFDYRVQAGDALSAFYHAQVVPRPAVDQIDLRYDPPSYTRRPPETLQATDGNVRALRGTVVTLTARTNKPVQAAELLINDEPAPGKRLDTPPGDPVCSFQFTLTPELAGRWSLKLTDEHGFASSTAEHTIELVPDNPPTVTIVTPEQKRLRLPPTARVPIAFTLEDDVGIRRGDILVEVDGRPRPPIAIPLDGDGAVPLTAATGETTLALTSLKLRGAKYLTFQLRATDGLPKPFKGPQHGVSELYRIDLDVRAPSFEVAQVMDAERKLKDTLKKVEKDLRKAKSDAARLKRDLAKAEEPTRNDNERIDRLRTELANAEANARRAAEMMRDSHYEGLAEKAQELADKHIGKAENLAGQIPLADEPQQRGMLAKETERTIDRSLEAVKELLEEIEPVTDVVRKALEAQELADRQADLAREKLAMDKAQKDGKAAEGQMTPEDWKKAQEALAADLAEAAKDTPGAERASREMDAKAAAEAAQEAAEMAKEQQALADAARRLDKLQETDKALAELAQKQDALGRDAAAADATRDQAMTMDQAADAIRADQLDKAVQQQAAAEDALKKKADELAQAAGDQPAADQAPKPGDAAKPEGDQAPKPGDAAQPEGDQAPQPGDAAKQAADLAERQGDLRERTDALRQERDQLAAEHGRDQAERLQAEQAEVAREAQALAGEVGEAAPQADRLQDQAANAAGEAAKALQEDQMAEAAQQAERAGEQLGQLAERLEEAAAAPFAPEAQPAGAEAGEQGQAEAEPAGAEAGEQGQAEGEPAGAEAGEQAQAAGEPAGAEAGEQPQAGGKPAGAEAGEKAQAAGKPAGAEAGQPGDPQQAAGLAQEAAAIAERQQQLAREMQALAQGDPLAQAAAQQQALAERAAQLAEQAAGMQQRAQEQGLGAQAQQAAEAAQQLAQAQQQAAAAGDQLAAAQGEDAAAAGQPAPGEQGQPGAAEQGQPAGAEPGQPGTAPGQQPGSQGGPPTPAPSAAQGAQKASAQALAAAAQAMSALAQGMGQAAQQAPGAPAGDPAAAAQQMASAQQSSAQAAQSQSAMPAAQAAGQLGKMAANAASQAQAMGGNMQNQPDPKGGGEPKEGTGAQSADLSKAKLKELGIKLDDWARLPGELRDQILQAAQQSGPAEYRSLIKRYFQQIAKRGGAKPKAKK